MGQKLYRKMDSESRAFTAFSNDGGVRLRFEDRTNLIDMDLSEEEALRLMSSLEVWKKSRTTKFEVGDTVYEPNCYKRAGKIISILDDRVLYDAPYRVQFIDQAEGKPSTDYFSADDLVLVARKGEL